MNEYQYIAKETIEAAKTSSKKCCKVCRASRVPGFVLNALQWVRCWGCGDASTLRNQAAEALDATHVIGERGPRTLTARNRLATWLDLDKGSISQVCSDIRTLRGTESEHIATTINQLLKGIRLNRSVPEARTAVRLAIRRTRQLRGILEARAI